MKIKMDYLSFDENINNINLKAKFIKILKHYPAAAG